MGLGSRLLDFPCLQGQQAISGSIAELWLPRLPAPSLLRCQRGRPQHRLAAEIVSLVSAYGHLGAEKVKTADQVH